jgi:catalase
MNAHHVNRTYLSVHAKGIMTTGTFTPSAEAKLLSIAPHFNRPSTPITVRFSNATGIPVIPDTDPNADPRGIAIRFNLGERVHTDIIAQSTPFTPTRTGAEFLEFLKAVAASPPGGPSPSPVEMYVGSHPKVLAFVQAPKPTPSSYAREVYFGVNAFKFVDAEGKAPAIRYRIVPDLGFDTLDDEALKGKDVDFLQKELIFRLQQGHVTFRLLAQVAEEGDVIDDATIHWPESRRMVDLGCLKLEKIVPDSVKEQKHIIFDPIPRIKGVETSDDPLLEMRAAVYLISGRQRRAAP